LSTRFSTTRTGAFTTATAALPTVETTVRTGVRAILQVPLEQSPAKPAEQTRPSTSEKIIFFISTPFLKSKLTNTPDRALTCNLFFRRELLYTIELLGLK
jgi:hypothetical protein